MARVWEREVVGARRQSASRSNQPGGHGARLWQENSNFGLFQFKATCLARLLLVRPVP